MGSERDQKRPRSIRILGSIAHFVLSSVIIFALSYILGHSILSGQLKGSDSGLHVGYAQWINTFFPAIPHWYPLQGGGESILHGYPLLAHYSVVVLHRISGLSILQAYRLICFLVFPITSMGIYIYCWTSLRKRTAGLLAAVFYLLAPLTWTWMYDWGFFAQSVGMIFLPPILISFDKYYTYSLEISHQKLRRLWMLVLILSLSLAILTHIIIGTGALFGLILYSLFFSLSKDDSQKSEVFVEGVKALIKSGIVVLLVLAFYFVPFFMYGQVANREGLNILALHQVPRIPIAEFLGIKAINPQVILTRMSNPLAAVIFFGIGILLSSRKSRKFFALQISAVIASILSVKPEITYMLGKVWPQLVRLISFRTTLIFAMILIPIGAGFGAWALAKTLLSLTPLIRQNDSNGPNDSSKYNFLGRLATSLLAILFVVFAVIQLGHLSASIPYHVNYGTNFLDIRDIWGERAPDICDFGSENQQVRNLCALPGVRTRINILEFWEECLSLKDEGLIGPKLCNDMEPSQDTVLAFIEVCEEAGNTEGEMQPCNARTNSLANQLELQNWSSFRLDDYDPIIAASQNLASILPDDPLLRIDVSSYHGRLAQDLTMYSNTSQIQSYTQQLSLIHLMWGYQLGVFYFEGQGSPAILNDLADWLGINYVFLDPVRDPIEKYQDANWIKLFEGPAYGERDIMVWQYSDSKQMATLSNNPNILVIGAPSKGVYPQVFGLANQGVAPYGEFLITEGKERIDQYSIDEIKAFDILFLHGYEYKSGSKAWDLLYQYVEGGGSLFIDTGWQFQVPEWEFKDAPQVLPVKKLSWTSYGKENTYELLDNDIAGDIDVTQFDPLIWEQDAWSVSGASSDDLKDWAQSVLLVQGHPLIAAGELGDGRIVWSGMNLISHLITYDNEEEKRLLHNLLDWLSYNRKGNEVTHPLVRRDHPDEVHFSFNGQAENITWLYWREAYYPNWHAYLSDEVGEREVPIYRGGPGFMLMPIETSSNEVSVTLRWESSFIESASIIVSILGVLILFGIAIDGLFLGGQGLTWIKIAFAIRMPKPFLDEETHRGAEKKPLQVIDTLPRTDQDVLASGKETFDTNAFETQLSDEEEALMKSWLDDKDNEDDPWVSKMLDPDQRK